MDVEIASHTLLWNGGGYSRVSAPATFAEEMFLRKRLGAAVTEGSRRCHAFVTESHLAAARNKPPPNADLPMIGDHMLKLDGSSVLITGASSGIGQAI
jgi:hypothetical protein